jgi:L-ascorbate metabolism protein UlaG (beta-lactamase superfamily)
MKLQLVRHATWRVEYGGVRFLLDPMLSEALANPPIVNTTNELRNPMVPLPDGLDNLLNPDAVIVSHLHPDHWDEAAVRALPKDVPLLCQPGDESKLKEQGFSNVQAIESSLNWRDVQLQRVGGQHGTGEIGRKMGKVSGFILSAAGEPTLYFAGDTIYCEEVKDAVLTYKPHMTVVNAGGARFAVGDPITMTDEDIIKVCLLDPAMRVAAAHMDTINHCLIKRSDLRERLTIAGFIGRVDIPEDGDWL